MERAEPHPLPKTLQKRPPCPALHLPQKSLTHMHLFFFNPFFRNHKTPFPEMCASYLQCQRFRASRSLLHPPSPLSVPLWLWLLSFDPWWHHDFLCLAPPPEYWAGCEAPPEGYSCLVCAQGVRRKPQIGRGEALRVLALLQGYTHTPLCMKSPSFCFVF